MVRSLSPYLKLRENETRAHDCDSSEVESSREAPEPSRTSPAFTRLAAICGHPDSEPSTDAPVIAVSNKQTTRYFVITNHARNGRGLRSYRRAVMDQASFRIFWRHDGRAARRRLRALRM